MTPSESRLSAERCYSKWDSIKRDLERQPSTEDLSSATANAAPESPPNSASPSDTPGVEASDCSNSNDADRPATAERSDAENETRVSGAGNLGPDTWPLPQAKSWIKDNETSLKRKLPDVFSMMESKKSKTINDGCCRELENRDHVRHSILSSIGNHLLVYRKLSNLMILPVLLD